jgi:hypothetical protein
VYRQWQNDAKPASRELTIVGVVGSVKMFAPDQTIERPSIYIPTDGGYSCLFPLNNEPRFASEFAPWKTAYATGSAQFFRLKIECKFLSGLAQADVKINTPLPFFASAGLHDGQLSCENLVMQRSNWMNRLVFTRWTAIRRFPFHNQVNI